MLLWAESLTQGIFVPWGCNKLPQTWGLMKQKLSSLCCGDQKSEIQVAAWPLRLPRFLGRIFAGLFQLLGAPASACSSHGSFLCVPLLPSLMKILVIGLDAQLHNPE